MLEERSLTEDVDEFEAVRLRAETVQTMEWVAKRLHPGSRAYTNHLPWRARKESTIQ